MVSKEEREKQLFSISAFFLIQIFVYKNSTIFYVKEGYRDTYFVIHDKKINYWILIAVYLKLP